MSNKSLGESRVRTEFNPSNDTLVDQIKQKSAELINLVNNINPETSGNPVECQRAKHYAEYQYEDAAMWAVKAATS